MVTNDIKKNQGERDRPHQPPHQPIKTLLRLGGFRNGAIEV